MAEEKKNKQLLKMFGLTVLAINNRTTVFVLSFLIFIGGIIGYNSMPKESFPEVEFPTIFVSTPYPGNSPENVEKLITRPLEKEINTITGVDEIRSTSVQDFSMIIIEFQTDIEVDNALRDVKDAIDRSQNELPELDDDPQAEEINVAEFPIMNVNLFGDHSTDELNSYAEILEDRIEQLREISDVNIKGVEDKEVKVNLDVHKMTSLQLSFQDVANAIAGRNVTMSAGNVKKGGIETSLKIDGQFDDPSEIEDIIVKDENEKVVYLRDIISSPVVLAPKEKESFARFNHQNVVMLDVIKRSGQNLLSASDKISAILDEVRDGKTAIPEDVKVVVTLDQSDKTRAQVSNLENSIVSGVILVVLVLLFFLGTRNALFVGIAIPMSMMLSFIILNAMGVTINMMVLFGLIMALGMLVDNGIVVVENIYRLMSEGFSAFEAAKIGVSEVAWPIISSTATTLAAFLPLAVWPGIMGEFMYYLPLTLIVVLSSSLFVALVINPVFTSVFMKIDNEAAGARKTLIIGGIMVVAGVLIFPGSVVVANMLFVATLLFWLNVFVLTPASIGFQQTVLPFLERWYENTLQFAFKGVYPAIFFVSTVLLLVFSVVIFATFPPKVLFFPESDPQYVNAFIEMPLGTDIESTNEVAWEIEKQIDTLLKKNNYESAVKALTAQVGKGTSDPGDPMASSGSATPHKGRVTVEFVEFKYRDEVSSQDVMDDIRDNLDLSKIPDASVSIDKDQVGPPVGKPINIELTGEDYNVLIKQAEIIKTKIGNSNIQGIEELKTDLELGKPEKRIVIDNAKAERLGVSTRDLANVVRSALFGSEVSKYKDGEDDYPIYVRLDEEYRHNFNALMNQKVTFRDPATGKIRQIPINSVAHLEPSFSFGSINRKDMDRVVTIYSNVVGGFNATEINNQLKRLLKDHTMPAGYELKFTGEQESQEEEMAFLQGALFIAVALILMIIIAQFNRVSAPLIIIFSVILSTIGVFLGLVVFNMEFVIIMTMIGIISLAGIVVNNAIVLIDYSILIINQRKQELGVTGRLEKQELIACLVKAGKTRLRPVLLTAITTVLGLLPLALGFNIDFFGLFERYDPDIYFGGENAAFWGPMSWTIIFGITFATFMTLVIVPLMFFGVELFKRFVFKKREQIAEGAGLNAHDKNGSEEYV